MNALKALVALITRTTTLLHKEDNCPSPDLQGAYSAYASARGRPAQSLSKEERQQAVLTAMLDGLESLAQYGDSNGRTDERKPAG